MADRTSTHDVAKVGGRSGDYAESAVGFMTDLKAPQPGYIDMIQRGGYVQVGDGFALSFDRATSDHVLRHHELFSSRVEMGLGNVRPLIPLNVDPPLHAKYRKLLDPLFAPRRMEAQEEDITRRVNGFIDTFIDRGECNFSEEFAELLPSSVFLGLMGLPEEELTHFIHLRDGILHPDKIDPDAMMDPDARRAVQAATGQEIYEYFGGVIADRQRAPRDDVISGFLAAEIDGDRLTTDEILDILFLFLIAGLDTVSDSLTCFYAFLAQNPEHRRQIVADPTVIPSAVEELLRWESPVPAGVPRVATEDTELPNGELVSKGTAVVVSYGAANVDPAAFADGTDVRFDRDGEPAHRIRRWRPSLSGKPPGPARTSGHAPRVASAHSRVPHQARARGPRVPARTPARQGSLADLGLTPRGCGILLRSAAGEDHVCHAAR